MAKAEKIPFLIDKAFNIETKCDNGRIFLKLAPKQNLWHKIFLLAMVIEFIKDEIKCKLKI